MLPRVLGRLTAVAALAAVAACSSTAADTTASGSAPAAPASSLSASPSSIPSGGPSGGTPGASTTAPAVVGANGGPVRPEAGTGRLGPGFVTPTAPPAPGGTMTPTPGSWSGVRVPVGYTAVLLATDDSAAARHLSQAVRSWAAAHRVRLREVPAHDPSAYVTAIQHAIDLHPDLVISAGDPLADPLALVTASWLEQRFLLLGAELAEPTYNVTAAVWRGTTARGGGNGTGNAWRYDPSTFTVERATRALDAGVAAVLRGYTGYVVQVE